MNEERNLDEYQLPVNTPKIKYEQIQRPFKESRLIKESQITCKYQDYIISIRMMIQGEVQVFVYEKQEVLQRYIIQIDGGMICQNGCQIFNINNQIHLLFILQDGQIILRNLSKDQSQNMTQLNMDLVMISKSSRVKEYIHFAALKDGNELLDISITANELQAKPLKLQTGWLDYFKQNKGFDYFLEVQQGLHILVINDQLQIVQINNNSIDQYRHRINLPENQRKVQEIEYVPFSPFINQKRRLICASIIIKTYSTLDLYELTFNCYNLNSSMQAQELLKFEIKGCNLEPKRSYQLLENCLHSSQFITLSFKYLFLMQDNQIRYINIFSQSTKLKQIFNEMVEEDNQLISVLGDEIPKILYLSNISLLCESFHILQAQYCNINQKAYYQLKQAKEEQYSSDYVVLFQQFQCQFQDFEFDTFLVALKLIFGKPFIIADYLINYQSPQLLQLLDDVIQDNIDVLIFMQQQLREFDKNGVIKKLLSYKLIQLNNFILSSEPPQIEIRSKKSSKNDHILRLIQIASRNLLQDIHNYYFYCLLGLYILQDYHLDQEIEYQQAYFLLLSACKIQQMKPTRNHIISILSEYDLSQEDTYVFIYYIQKYADINQGVNIAIGCILNYKSSQTLDVIANAKDFHSNTYQFIKIYPLIDQRVKLELSLVSLVRQGEIFESQQELLQLITRYELLYGKGDAKYFVEQLIQQYCNQDLINTVLLKYDKGDQLALRLLKHPLKFKQISSLHRVLQQVNFKNDDQVNIELLTPVLCNEQVLKELSKIKLGIHIIIQRIFLNDLDKETNIIRFINGQPIQLRSRQREIHFDQELSLIFKNLRIKKISITTINQSAQLLMTFYEILDLQDKQHFILQYQIDVLDITLNTLNKLGDQDKYVLIFKDKSNVQFFKDRLWNRNPLNLSKKNQKLNNKLINSYEQQLQDAWSQIDKQANDNSKQHNQEQIEIEYQKNTLSLEEYIKLEKLNQLPDDFRFQHGYFQSDKLKRASFIQKQLEYNRGKNNQDRKSKLSIQQIQERNYVQNDSAQKVQHYKVYQFKELNDLLLIKQIQYFLSMKGFQYTEDYHIMAVQIIEIVQHLENNYHASSQKQLIDSIMFYVPLMTFVSSYKINSYFTICLGICKTFKLLEQLLNLVIDDNLTSVLARIIVRFLSQHKLDKLLVYYFAQAYTEYAIQELVYLENNPLAEKLTLILLKRYTKAKLQGKSFSLKTETVEAITQIEGSVKLNDALKIINKITQSQKVRSEQIKLMQMSGISYEQYKIIKQKKLNNPQQDLDQEKQKYLKILDEVREKQKYIDQEFIKDHKRPQGEVDLRIFLQQLNFQREVKQKRKGLRKQDEKITSQEWLQKKQEAVSQDSYSFNELQQQKLTVKKKCNTKPQQYQANQQIDQEEDYFHPQEDQMIYPKYTNALRNPSQSNPLKEAFNEGMIPEGQDSEPKFTIKVKDANKLNIPIEDPYNLGPFIMKDSVFRKQKDSRAQSQIMDSSSHQRIISEVKQSPDFEIIPEDDLNVELQIKEDDDEVYFQDKKRKKRQISLIDEVRMQEEEEEHYNKYFNPKASREVSENRLLLQDAFKQPTNQPLISQQIPLKTPFSQIQFGGPIQSQIDVPILNAFPSQQNEVKGAQQQNLSIQQLLFPKLQNQLKEHQYEQVIFEQPKEQSQIEQPKDVPQQEQKVDNSFSFDSKFITYQVSSPNIFSIDSRASQILKPKFSSPFQQRPMKDKKSAPLLYEDKPEDAPK